MQPEQSYANHRRFHPLFHFVLFPLLFANFVVRVVMAWRAPSALSVWDAVVALALAAVPVLARWYGLRNQDRLIRLEETLRLQRVLPEELRARIGELRTRHLVGLRFCSDAELTDAFRSVIAGEAKDSNAIKQRVKTWRPDYLRL